MAVENAPWAVDGAKHSGAVARTLAYASTSGAEGIVEPADLRVRATQTPSGSVRVAPGGIAVLNRAPNGGQQTYTARNVSETLVDVEPTGSSGGRTDYVWAHIIDPEYQGQFPDNPQTAQYFFLTASAAQPEGNGWYRLARINIPASTATITNAMIEDIRELAQPKRENVIFARPRIMEDDDPRQNLLTSRFTGENGVWYGEYFPGGDGSPNEARIVAPEWATHMSIRADWLAVRGVSNLNCHGRYWVEYGDEYRNHGWHGGRQLEFATQQFAFDTTGTQGSYRMNWPVMDQVPVPAKLRGKQVRFAFKAGVSNDSVRDGVLMNALSGLGLDVTFTQKPINADTL